MLNGVKMGNANFGLENKIVKEDRHGHAIRLLVTSRNDRYFGENLKRRHKEFYTEYVGMRHTSELIKISEVTTDVGGGYTCCDLPPHIVLAAVSMQVDDDVKIDLLKTPPYFNFDTKMIISDFKTLWKRYDIKQYFDKSEPVFAQICYNQYAKTKWTKSHFTGKDTQYEELPHYMYSRYLDQGLWPEPRLEIWHYWNRANIKDSSARYGVLQGGLFKMSIPERFNYAINAIENHKFTKKPIDIRPLR